MQIATVNQTTKSIRPPSFDASVGSQWMKSATAVAPAPTSKPIVTSRTIDPLRTVTEPTQRPVTMP
ncbi:MAG: hypothetical protein E6G45_09485 [Actinobacteria bacterium]|nr:MAG: hypothetical protein E6G45_09485 [Actinomycetota bacterium]